MFEIFTDDLLDEINAYRKEKGLWTWPQNEDLQRLALAWAFWGQMREVKDLGRSSLEAYFPPEGFSINVKRKKVYGKVCEKTTKEELLQRILREEQETLLEPVIYQAGTALVTDGECWTYVVLLAKEG